MPKIREMDGYNNSLALIRMTNNRVWRVANINTLFRAQTGVMVVAVLVVNQQQHG